MNSSDEELPQSIQDDAAAATMDILPTISKERYEKQYQHFENWRKEQGVTSLKEDVFLAYFLELSSKLKPNTLWSRYSMIKSVLKLRENVDLSRYFKLTAYLKKKNVGLLPKKALVFTKEHISTFMQAPDEMYLLIKVATIFGLAGACRRAELKDITIDNIQEKDTLVIVRIPDSKNHTQRSFVISEEVNNGDFLNLYKKYASMRPAHTPHRRFFLAYSKGRCTTQCVGVNTFGKMPSEIAAYLRLPNPECYTGHSFRRSSATFLADAGEEITNVKRLGGWKSTTVAESYLQESESHKKNLCNKILTLDADLPSSSSSNSQMVSEPRFSMISPSVTDLATASNTPSSSGNVTSLLKNQQLSSAINLQSASNCTFTININNNK